MYDISFPVLCARRQLWGDGAQRQVVFPPSMTSLLYDVMQNCNDGEDLCWKFVCDIRAGMSKRPSRVVANSVASKDSYRAILNRRRSTVGPDDKTNRKTVPHIGECILSGLETLWKHKQMTDVSVVVENKTYLAHKLVLASCSDFFYDKFTRGRDAEATKIEVNDVKATGECGNEAMNVAVLLANTNNIVTRDILCFCHWTLFCFLRLSIRRFTVDQLGKNTFDSLE